jgi:hypothetical protein
MHSETLDYEVLDLGLVYYKNIIKDPQKVIDMVNELDDYCLKNPNTSLETKPWVRWSDNSSGTNQFFCWQKFINQPENINKEDLKYNENLYISKTLFGAIDKVMDHYSTKLYPFAKNNLKSREKFMHLLRYDEGGYLPPHQDQGVSTRVLSVLIYLNDNYEGGEIEFPQSGIKIRPSAGSLIFFPSNFLYVHTVNPLISGTRYALPNWYHNVSFENKKDSTGEE